MGKLFSLDIGTRSIVGLLCEEKEKVLHIVDFEQQEYLSRAMYDGQIHDIQAVANVIQQVKESLESRNKVQLTKVGIALAGRSLMTKRHKIQQELVAGEEITPKKIKDLELKALSELVVSMNQERVEADQYHCVGYSVINYELDGIELKNLEGHFGKLIKLDLIATFLPRIVLDSVLNALKIANLEPVNITLEPIAAIHTVIPEDLRRLNLALIDIGAGTSDIAITKNGSIIGYGMVPIAGDEITETLCDSLLVDFDTAEIIKRSLTTQKEITFQDIFQKAKTIPAKQIFSEVLPEIKKLAEALAKEVITLNGKAPRAVVLIGGGSLIPGLIQCLNETLKIKQENIGFRTLDSLSFFVDETESLNSTEFITPVGIARATQMQEGLQFLNIDFNEQTYRILQLENSMSLKDVLNFLGIEQKSLTNKPGNPLVFNLNGSKKIIKGSLGKSAEIYINNQVAILKDQVTSGDKINYIPAIHGQAPKILVSSLIENIPQLGITFNDENYKLPPTIFKNNKEADADTYLEDNDNIQIKAFATPMKILKLLKVDIEGLFKEVAITFNSISKVLRVPNFTLIRNNEIIELDTAIYDGDSLTFKESNNICRIRDVIRQEDNDFTEIILNNKPILIPNTDYRIYLNGQVASEVTAIDNGVDIRTIAKKVDERVLSHLFKYLPLKPKDNVGRNLVMKVNGQDAGFTTPISQGAAVTIYWD